MKKLLSLVVSAALAVSNISIIALAKDEYIKGFSQTGNYTAGQFSDIGEEWYSGSVRTAYEVGLMKGDSVNTFNPDGQLTNAEAVAIAARIHSIYNYGKDSFNTTSPWYQAYIDYAVSNNICDNNFNPDDTAQRSTFVGIIGNAIDTSVLSEKNSIADNSLSDVSGWYSEAVYKMYRAGILCGNDKYGTFAPETSITRAEVAAILSRIVKPDERIAFVPETKPFAEYSIMDDDGSLNAFKQRAILANLKVMLNGEDKDEKWNSDTWSKFHEEVPGDYIFVDSRDIELRYFTDDLISVFVPNRYFGEMNDAYKRVGDWSLYSGFRSYLDGYSGSMPDGKYGDLYLSKPSIAAYTDSYTYDSFTSEAQGLINSAEFIIPSINSSSVREHIEKTYGNCQNNIYIGYLTDWEDSFYITMNKNDMYRPTPREYGNANQTEYVFTPTDSKTKEWCKNNLGKYVVAYVNLSLDNPLMLSEISGYADTKDKAEIKSWSYIGGALTLEWQSKTEVTFINPIVIIDNQMQQELLDVSGLLPAIETPYGLTGSSLYDNVYSISDFADSYDYFGNRIFFMFVDGDNISIVKIDDSNRNKLTQGTEPEHQTIQLTVNSDKAIIDGLELKYDFTDSSDVKEYGQDFKNYISTGKGQSVSVSPKPKKVNGIVYLPSEFIIKTLYKDNLDYEDLGVNDYRYDEDDEVEYPILSGYAEVCNEVRTDWTYYLYGYEKTKFRLRRSSIIDGYDYGISKSSNGPHIGFNIDSEKACVQVWYNGTEYGEKIVTIPKPKMIYGSVYLPIEILDLLELDGEGWSRHKI